MTQKYAKAFIKIEAYSSQWHVKYKQLREIYRFHLAGLYQDIQHVGSTSVKGLDAKPVLDIDIIIEDETQLSEILNRLKDIGYRYLGTAGIPGRHAFAPSEICDAFGKAAPFMAHNLYVCVQGCTALENHIHFRNYLRTHPETMAEYSALKRQLAADAPSLDWYASKKTAFITGVLQKCGFSSDTIDIIRAVNQEKQ